MKAERPAHLSVLIVGHRRPWNRSFRLTPKQWKLAAALIGGVIPLFMAVGVYGALAWLFAPHSHPLAQGTEVRVLRNEVALVTHNTSAGLDAMGLELGALNSEAEHLTTLQDQLMRSTGVHIRLARPPASSVRPDQGRHLMASLRTLSRQLQTQHSTKPVPRQSL